MTFRQWHRLAGYALVLIGGFALLYTEEFQLPLLSLAPAGVLAGMMLDRRPRLQAALAPLNTWGFYPILLFAAVDFLVLTGEVPLVFVHATMLLLLVKCVSAKQLKDWMQIYALTFLQLVAATILSFEIYFAAVFIVYLSVAAVALRLHTLLLDLPEEHPLASSRPPLGFWLSSLAIPALVLTVAAGVFVLLPRTQWAYLRQFNLGRAQFGTRTALSGFGETTTLGDISSIYDDNAVVARVQLETEVANRMATLSRLEYWKGIALDRFDGHTWTNTTVHDSHDQRSLNVLDLGFLDRNSRRSHRYRPLRLRVNLEPSSARYYFFPTPLLALQPKHVWLYYDIPSGTVRKGYSDYNAQMYQLEVGLMDPGERQMDFIALPEAKRPLFLQVPEAMRGPWTAWMREHTAGIESPYEQAVHLEQLLQTTFTYSRENIDLDDADPLSDFLFRTREGHCELFASALALGLRTLGIPTRLVNGFLAGEVNPTGEYLILRRSDAHSWVEAWFDDRGRWETFDATPPDLRRPPQTEAPGVVARWLDRFKLWWNDSVVDYSYRNQQDAFHGLYSLNRKRRAWMSGEGFRGALSRERAATLFVGVAAVLALLILAALAVKAIRRRRRYAAPGGFWFCAIDRLAKEGYVLGETRTAEEFLEQLDAANLPAERARTIWRLTALYYEVRFGRRALSEEETAEVEQALETLRKPEED